MSIQPKGQRQPQPEPSPSHALRLARLVLALAEHDANGLSRDELVRHPQLVDLYDLSTSAGEQRLHQDLAALCALPLRQAKATPEAPPGALARIDRAGRYHLARPLRALCLGDPELGTLGTLLDLLHEDGALPGSAELRARILDLVPLDQRAVIENAEMPRGFALDLDLGALSEEHREVAQRLLRAWREHHTIAFAYRPLYKETPTRHEGDEVIGLFLGQHAYACLWCQDAQAEIDFRLERIEPGSLQVLPKLAKQRERHGVPIRYHLAPRLAESAATRHLTDQHADEQPDGSVIVSGKARNLFWAQRLLLGYGEHARALAPPELVARMRDTITQMARVYHDDAAPGPDEKKDIP